MGDVHERDADLALDPLKFELHGVAKLEVERAEGFVEKQCLREVDQRTSKRHALLLTARKLSGPATCELGQADDLEHFADALFDRVLVRLLRLRSEGHVVEDIHMREQRVLLEDGVYVAPIRRHL